MTDSTQALTLPERFARAVRAGDVAELRRLAEHRAALREVVNAPSFGFDSPAIVAVAGRGDVELVDAVLALGADPNQRSTWWAGGFHALHSASGAVAERLLEAGAVPDACAAAQLDRVDFLEEMLRVEPARAQERGGDGQTPLHFARSRRAIDMLVAAGADIDARDVDHRSTPAEWMLGDADDPARSRLELARYLVALGASADLFLVAALGLTSRARIALEQDPSLLAMRTGRGTYGERPPSSFHIYTWTIGQNLTPLQAAVRFGQRETLEVMTRFATPEQRLLLACHRARSDEARAIMHEHPGIVEGLTADDRGAITDEAWNGNGPAVSLMMALGFEPAASGASGGTALHCAAWQGSAESVRAILDHERGRALIEQRDPHFKSTPLGWCCHGSLNRANGAGDYAAVATMLIAAGARVDPNAVNASDPVRRAINEALRARPS